MESKVASMTSNKIKAPVDAVMTFDLLSEKSAQISQATCGHL